MSSAGTSEETILGEGRETAPQGVELSRGACVGRYVVLGRLGQGAMGTVYVAHDPELDRKVAIKVLRDADASDETRMRMLREAQALAKLSHPNVVTIHDVGQHEGSVYLAMEFVEGVTLDRWMAAEPRAWPAVVATMTAVAEGLAAAHDKGLLHRDVKPANIMVGDDGRVRLMDFGLAREGTTSVTKAETRTSSLDVELTDAGALLGTPAYMAPEQFRGIEVGPAADQFSFCVTLFQALYGERPFAGTTTIEIATHVLDGEIAVPRSSRSVPGWLRRACVRGLELDPARRWPSMRALAHELGRGRRRQRVRLLVGAFAAIALFVAGSEGWRRAKLADQMAACADEAAAIDEVWNADRRRDVVVAIEATGSPMAPGTLDRLIPRLQERSEAWRGAKSDACTAHEIEGVMDDATYDKVTWCLELQRVDVDEFVDALTRADESTLGSAMFVLTDLGGVDECVRAEVLAVVPPPPAEEERAAVAGRVRELARALALTRAERSEEALAMIEGVLADLERDSRERATALVVKGETLAHLRRLADAENALTEAFRVAALTGDWRTASSAASSLINLVGSELARPGEGRVWAVNAEVAARHGGDPLGLRESRRLQKLASVERAAGEHALATELDERVLAVAEETLGSDHVWLANALGNLGSDRAAQGRYDEARPLYERALSIRESALGPNHPEVAAALSNLATIDYFEGKYAEALRGLGRALEIYDALVVKQPDRVAIAEANRANIRLLTRDHRAAVDGFSRAIAILEDINGVDHPSLGVPLTNVGQAHIALGELDAADQVLRRALQIRETRLGKEHVDVSTTLSTFGDLAYARGNDDEAGQLYERALEIREKSQNPEHPNVGFILDGLARVATRRGQATEAIAFAERAVALRTKTKAAAVHEATSRFVLARALAGAAEGERDAARVVSEAEKAVSLLRGVDGQASVIEEIEGFLGEVRR